MKQQKTLTLKTLTKSNVWDVQENDILRLWKSAEKDADIRDNVRHFTDIIKSAFELEEVKVDRREVVSKYEQRGYTVGTFSLGDGVKVKWAIKKRPIKRVTDLTYENIRHISAAKLLEVVDRNFGGGWDSLSQSIKDIIESGFDISTTTLPKDRIHKEGGMYDRKIKDGFEVLEIEKGAWVEAIFAKPKPVAEKIATTYDYSDDDEKDSIPDKPDVDAEAEGSDYNDADNFDEEILTEESYRTTFDEDTESISLEAEEVSDDDDGF